MSDDCTCLFGHEPSEICRESSPIPEECSHWKATRSIPCKEIMDAYRDTLAC
ncbi:9147_t:CDS:2 [Entrophospora sp. SA101]|nr:12666_t:CDS:2 [Entrophospora sp. SA101]CAJ0843063.1 9147_t:CDS:2 [Entrophospora sp. SA101]